jgi:hypothetical protein
VWKVVAPCHIGLINGMSNESDPRPFVAASVRGRGERGRGARKRREEEARARAQDVGLTRPVGPIQSRVTPSEGVMHGLTPRLIRAPASPYLLIGPTNPSRFRKSVRPDSHPRSRLPPSALDAICAGLRVR